MSFPLTIYIGAFVHSKSQKELEICASGAIGVDAQGVIAFISKDVTEVSTLRSHPGFADAHIVQSPSSASTTTFFAPGFIDTHIHASQYPNAGIFGSSTLLDWLEQYTFPMEASFASLERAQQVYTRVVERTLSHGTTCAAYYATIHVPATNFLADTCFSKGQRAFVGRVCMDRMAPDYYRDASVESALADTAACIRHCHELDPERRLVIPVITPRFAPSCTDACLNQLGELATKTQLPVQTHISENKAEIALVKELFPTSKSYMHVYDDAGLLNSRTILAHCVHLSPEETALVQQRRSGISHCPLSNTALTSGAAPIQEYLAAGIPVGLGTDVSGGYSPSILEEARHAVLVSRHVAMGARGTAVNLSVPEALWLATCGGARVLGLEDQVGHFAVGMHWDAQMIVLPHVGSSKAGAVPSSSESAELSTTPVDLFGWEPLHDVVAKWFFNGDDRNVAKVWVRGRLVHRRY